MLASVEYVSFSAGGTNGFCFHGVIDAIEMHMGTAVFDAWRRRNIRGVAGCSAGALAALCFAIGIDREQRQRLTAAPELSDPRCLVRAPDLGLVMNRFGIDQGAGVRAAVGMILETGGLAPELTLQDLQRLVGIEFVCVASNLASGARTLLSAATHPQMRVVDAVYASSAVPLLYTPYVLDDGTQLVDGCLTESLPHVFDAPRTLFVCIDHSPPRTAVSSLPEYASALMSFATRTQRMPADAAHVVSVPLGDVIFDFRLTPGRVREIRDAGFAIACDWLQGGVHRRAIARAVVVALLQLRRHRAVSEEGARSPPAAAQDDDR